MTKRKPRSTALLVATALFVGSIATIGAFELTGSLGTTKVIHQTTTVVRGTRSSALSTGSKTTLSARTLYASASPGVVDIAAEGVASPGSQAPFGSPGSSQSTASGSGFVLDKQGHIVTAAHVVEGASTITVKFHDGTTRKATVLGVDNATDVAVLKIDASGLDLHPLTLGSSSALRIGDTVAAIGDPFGYERSFSIGIVSGLDRTIEAPNGFTVAHAVQTDAALNPGNSGGPVLDSQGHVIGIVDQIATDGSSEQSSGVGFAVPINLIKSELATLEAGKTVDHAYIGLSSSDATDGTRGALVADVTSGGPAAVAGVKSGDIVTAIGGEPVTGTSDLVAIVAAHSPGDSVAVTVVRNGDTHKLTVKLGTQPRSSSLSTSG